MDTRISEMDRLLAERELRRLKTEQSRRNMVAFTCQIMPDYSPIGKHKARMFQSALGFGPEHAEELQRQVMGLLPVLPAARKTDGVDLYGERFNVLVPVTGANGKTVAVNTSWIYARVKNTRRLAPRLVTMRVSEKKP